MIRRFMILKPSARVSWQTYENKVYILDETDETMMLLEDAGFQFWTIMLSTPQYDELLLKLKSLYILGSEKIADSLKIFVGELVKYNIIEVYDE
jgi:hypothetical protein